MRGLGTLNNHVESIGQACTGKKRSAAQSEKLCRVDKYSPTNRHKNQPSYFTDLNRDFLPEIRCGYALNLWGRNVNCFTVFCGKKISESGLNSIDVHVSIIEIGLIIDTKQLQHQQVNEPVG